MISPTQPLFIVIKIFTITCILYGSALLFLPALD